MSEQVMTAMHLALKWNAAVWRSARPYNLSRVMFLLLNWLWAHIRLPALEEARDICTYLMPLWCFYEDMETAEFPDVRSQIGPLMHTVCLVWANSQYYSTPARLIVLLQETCNLLIQQVGSIKQQSSLTRFVFV